MEDRFDQTVKEFLIPIDRLVDGPSDTVYFLHKKGGLVYCEGYAHPPGGFYGALIKYPDPDGHINLFGRNFNWTHRQYVDGNLEIVPYDEQVRRQIEVIPELASRPPRPPYADYFCHFLLDEFDGFFDNKHSLRIWLESSPRIAEIISSLEDLLGVSRDRIGCTGSLAYGYYEEPLEDVDAVFFNSVSENRELADRIKELKRREPEREVFELGKTWPLRFTHMGTIICPFFKYARQEEIPIKECRMEIIRETVTATGIVTDDRHALYCPSLLTLDEVILDGGKRDPLEIVIYDGALRGEYYKGTRLRITAQLVKIITDAKTVEALLVTKPGATAVEAQR